MKSFLLEKSDGLGPKSPCKCLWDCLDGRVSKQTSMAEFSSECSSDSKVLKIAIKFYKISSMAPRLKEIKQKK